ncbi:MAG: DUF45 domain-containing protein [Oscillospiraceae bacterium]|nr:DUF45 domain-containing protein [Oscillospiraceae bacterium]
MHFTHDGKTYEYTIVRKRIKNIILHVRADGTVYVSAPPAAPESVIHAFVTDNAGRLVQQIAQNQKHREDAPDYADGSALLHLGETITLHWSERPCPTRLEQDVLTVFARSPEEARLAHRRWLIDECVALYRQINREVYTAYTEAGYRVPLARIEIKEMKSRWGSCTAKTGRISMNFRLMQYPIGCVYAVFYHEYAHFMHLDHSADFYAVLRGVFPEYDRWDAILNHK